MRISEHKTFRDIVLVGGGHSHVMVLERFARQPLPGVRLTLIGTDTHTPYSGMLPGYVAGQYGYDDVHIDLRRLAACAGARFFRDEVIGIDRSQRRVLCRSRPAVAYDRLSINVGSQPALDKVAGAAENAVAVKPVRVFNQRWLELLERVRRTSGPTTIAVVGAGAGGVELILALQYRLGRELNATAHSKAQACSPEHGGQLQQLSCHLFSADSDIMPTHNPRVRRSFERILAARGILVHRAAEVIAVEPGAFDTRMTLTTRSGERLACDEIFWVTQAAASAWLRESGLAVDADGFIAVGTTLQSSDPLIFAAGDCAAIEGFRIEKAGVFAVRQGPPLAENLRRSLLDLPLTRYRPQSRWLALISTGERYAVASRGAWYAEGRWVWRWKDAIDRRFMTRFQNLSAGSSPAATAGESAPPGVAIGCAADLGRLGAQALARARQGMTPAALPCGLAAAGDATILCLPPGSASVQTLTYCRAVIDDPWLFGRIAARHALDDMFALGGQAHFASAIVALPPRFVRRPDANDETQETLFQLLAGAAAALAEDGCFLAGSQLAEGAELALAFAINGLIDADLAGLQGNSGMLAGDSLILTKALGSGALLAAPARLAVKGRWIDAALESMLVSNRRAASCLRAHAATACSTLGACGLLGRLTDMARAAGVAAEIELAALPVLDGALAISSAGLAKCGAGLPAACALAGGNSNRLATQHARSALLCETQTAGGLLASVPAASAAACLAALAALGYRQAAIIGRVLPADGAAPTVRFG